MKNTIRKHLIWGKSHTPFLLLSLLVTILPALLNGQDPDLWVLHSQTQDVKVYYQLADIEDTVDPQDPTGALLLAQGKPIAASVLLLKIENGSENHVRVEWFNQLKSDNDGSKSSFELQAYESGTTEPEISPKILLSVSQEDGYPVSVLESIELLSVEITVL